MNRAFKIQFHNGEPDEKSIVTLSVTVNNGKRFDALNEAGKSRLLAQIELFEKMLTGFKTDLYPPFLTVTPAPPKNLSSKE